MDELTPTRRRELRAAAHHLKPVASVSQKGLSPTVLAEIDRCLKAHELIKVRLYDIDREQRTAMLGQICSELACVPVQEIGKLLVLWRENTEKAEQAMQDITSKSSRPLKSVSKKQAAAALERRQRKSVR